MGIALSISRALHRDHGTHVESLIVGYSKKVDRMVLDR